MLALGSLSLYGRALVSLAAGWLLVSTATAGSATPPMVHVGGETLRGAWLDGPVPVAAFRGVPFAAPPAGPARWRAPRAPRPRPGVQPATRFAPACMQGSGGVDWYVDLASAFGQGPGVVSRPEGLSEDCLYLNVWTPRPDPEARLPMMVFVHGGGNSGGWSYEPNYRGGPLAARGAVVATVAYRLGPFGFFAHPALEDDQGGPAANFALQDIRAAFEWLRRNAEAFGGDPTRIMAFGESSGALNLIDLLLADVARGRARDSLFRRLISQSIGGPLVERQDLAREQAIGLRLAERMGLAEGTIAGDLRAIPAADVLAAAAELPADYYPDGVIDGRILPRHPMEVLATERAEGLQMVLGSNADEWLMYTPESAGERELAEWLSQEAPGREQELLALVGGAGDPRRALDRLQTARHMLCPSRVLARWVNATGGDARLYYFSRVRPGPGGEKLGAYHGAELPYVFGTHDGWLPTTGADRELGEAMGSAWVAFAATGDPTASGVPAWPRYADGRASVMDFGDDIRIARPFADELCEILEPDWGGPGREPLPRQRPSALSPTDRPPGESSSG